MRTLVVKRGGVKRRMKGGEYRRGMERAEGMEPQGDMRRNGVVEARRGADGRRTGWSIKKKREEERKKRRGEKKI